jgi:hypothetical protein
MSGPDNNNCDDNFGGNAPQRPTSSRGLVEQIKLERQKLLRQIEVNQSTIIRSHNLIARLNSLLAKLGDSM